MQIIMKRNKMASIKIACALGLGLLSFIYTSYAVGASTNLTIKGNITNIPTDSPNLVHLYSYYGSELSEDASAPVNEQGDFKLEIKDTLQQGLYKIGLDQTNAVNIVLSGEKDIGIKADYGQLKTGRITVTNSRENKAYSVLLNEWKQLATKMAGLNIKKSQISTVDPFFTRKTKDIENKMRLIIEEHNVNLLYIKETYPDTFMSEVLVNLSLIPQLTDHPDLKDSYDNERACLHDYFFEFIDFADERIIYTPFLEKKYFAYLDKSYLNLWDKAWYEKEVFSQ